MDPTRRRLLLGGLLGAGGLGLRALATGLPLHFLSRRAIAAPGCTGAQRLVLSISGEGDPLNANVPGTYDHPDILHGADPAMAPTTLRLGGAPFVAARPWSTLPQWALDRACFFHHATLTNSHPNLPKVLRLMGGTARQEMLPSLLAQELAPCLGTIGREPAVIGAGDGLTFEGRALPSMAPTALRDVLAPPRGPLAGLQRLRDETLDEISAALRERGTAAQRRFLDSMAASHREARSLSDQLLDDLGAIRDDGPAGQVLAAAALLRMNVAPVCVIALDFGGDNHLDPGLRREAAGAVAGVAQLGALLDKIDGYGMRDQVTFANLHIFGRTLRQGTYAGRDHWGNHHVSVLIGAGVRPGVVGGVGPALDAASGLPNGQFSALPIDSASGAGRAGGDVSVIESLGALGQTLGAALRVPEAALATRISVGKVVRGALVS